MGRYLEEEGSWSLSFAGSGFLGLYHVGVTHCLRERTPRLLQGAHRFYGSSSGALNAVAIVCGKSVDFCCSHLLDMVKYVQQLSLGVFHPAFAPIEHIKQQLQDKLPGDAHVLASQRLGVSLTHWPSGRNIIVTDFASRDELIQALLCTLYFPFYCGVIPPEFRGKRYIDGALSNNVPFEDPNSTITVSPFHGTVDICPQSTSASLHELNFFNANFQISSKNFYLGVISLFPPKPEVVADHCRQGYLDALRFLERHGLSKEPVLWTLVSEEPPPPAVGTQDSGCDQDEKAGLALNWAVPNVVVKDVPNFEQLSPELEAALDSGALDVSLQPPGGTREPPPDSPSLEGTWYLAGAAPYRPPLILTPAQSGPRWVLKYLLLPCTLPFEYVYVRSRRVVAWLPEMPVDLAWVQGLLRNWALDIYSRVKAWLRGISLPEPRLLEAGPLQPGEAPPAASTLEPLDAHRA